MNKKFDIIICGGGTIGLCCALALSNKGFSVLIIDKNTCLTKINHDFDGRNIALNNATIRFFDSLNIWHDLHNKAQPIHDIIVSDGDLIQGVAGESYLHFDATDIQTESFGHFVLNPYIHDALIQKIKNTPLVTLYYDTEITNIHYGENMVHVTDNHFIVYEAALLIAADGKNSFIRTFSNIDTIQHDFKQTAIVLAIAHEKPHKGVAQELFLPAGPFAILPLHGNQTHSNQTSIVWVENHAMAQALLKAPDDVFMYELERRFGDYLGKLTIISQKFSYPLKMQLAKQIIAKRTLFIGDAAHIIHPISGQGFNLGVRDIQSLCDIIDKYHYAGLDIGSELMLREYSLSRHKDIQLLGNITSALNWLFSNDVSLLQSARRFGLKNVQKIPILKNFFSKSASEGGINY